MLGSNPSAPTGGHADAHQGPLNLLPVLPGSRFFFFDNSPGNKVKPMVQAETEKPPAQ